MMKKMMIPVMISENDSLSPKVVEISPAPLSRKTRRRDVRII